MQNFGHGVSREREVMLSFVGWVERSDTHRHAGSIDGYRCAPPILPGNDIRAV